MLFFNVIFLLQAYAVVCVSYLVLFMKTPNVNAISEYESWICHQLCSGFFSYCAMDCSVDLLEKAKKSITVFS